MGLSPLSPCERLDFFVMEATMVTNIQPLRGQDSKQQHLVPGAHGNICTKQTMSLFAGSNPGEL